ncbi:hypothetical protein BV898_07254 [Hypsibius exemplaris]|uniref:Ig-like domain-containing protein n=1 Tax=Hypsibius exemplaris TaxID=2072580 RepID=A0A1W0WTV2_HYPEX|nr:hypothetical protein BV898_07254 [Hypsibius exemplaris]
MRSTLSVPFKVLVLSILLIVINQCAAAELLQSNAKTEEAATARISGNVAFVEPKPPAFLEVMLHESVALVCEAASLNGPAPLIAWLRNGKPIHTGYNSKIHTDTHELNADVVITSTTRSILYLDCLSTSDVTATYTCVAGNTVSHVQTDTHLLLLPGQLNPRVARNCAVQKRSSAGTVRQPRIVMWSRNTLQLQGQAVTLFCRTTGVPAPRITWEFRYGQTGKTGEIRSITNDDRHVIRHNGDLVVRDLDFAEDMGLYVCKAQNSNGFDRAEAFLYPVKEAEA